MVLKNTGFAEGVRDEGRDRGGIWMGYGSGSGPLAARLVLVIYGGAIATAMSRLGSSGFVAAAGSARIGGS